MKRSVAWRLRVSLAFVGIALLCRPVLAEEAPKPTLEQRIGGIEAYIGNGDPGAALKDEKGRIPDGLALPISGAPGPGHNAWIMVSSALVLFMTLPGLALFYGGLVRRKNVLSVLAQCLGITGLVTILWWAFGYSFVFADVGEAGADQSSLVGSLARHAFFRDVTSAPNPNYSPWVSQNVFAMYQLMFAIITPALIVGAVAERMRFSAILVFVGFWMFIVYFPLAHMVWGIDGFMNGAGNPVASIKAIDFAGGTVVHMSSGWSALVLCLVLGPRFGFGKEKMAPHNMVLCMVGTGMLWVGWYGFNAGSAIAADRIAASAFTATTLAAAVAGFTWGAIEKIFRGHASILGICSGIVAGLVVITPASGFVTSGGAMIIGVCAGIVPYLACTKLKAMFGYDDALDTFGIHAIGGTLGALLTGFLASTEANPNLKANLSQIVGHTLWIEQLKAIGFTILLSVVGTFVIAFLVRAVMGRSLRVTREVEVQGLDVNEHGEEGYIL